jgi:hypothetical protein
MARRWVTWSRVELVDRSEADSSWFIRSTLRTCSSRRPTPSRQDTTNDNQSDTSPLSSLSPSHPFLALLPSCVSSSLSHGSPPAFCRFVRRRARAELWLPISRENTQGRPRILKPTHKNVIATSLLLSLGCGRAVWVPALPVSGLFSLGLGSGAWPRASDGWRLLPLAGVDARNWRLCTACNDAQMNIKMMPRGWRAVSCSFGEAAAASGPHRPGRCPPAPGPPTPLSALEGRSDPDSARLPRARRTSFAR